MGFKDFFANLWPQPYLWTISFFCWYQLYCSTFLGLISCSWYALSLLFLPFATIWLLSVSSLYKCLYTRPALIPHGYSVPQQIFNLLNKNDQRGVQTSEIDISAGSSSGSDNDSDVEHSKPRHRKISQWEQFYRELTDLAKTRNVNVRTSPMIFGSDTIQCPTVCTRCFVVKPVRTHHCRRCGKCITRMDHHCPAIGRCVQLTNHKFFLIFLLYATLLCIYAFMSMIPFLINAFILFYTVHPPNASKHYDSFTIPFTFSAMGCIQSMIFPMVLIWFQWPLWKDLMNNQTMLEDMKMETDQLPKSSNEYDRGTRLKNVESILGKHKRLWFVPIQTTEIAI